MTWTNEEIRRARKIRLVPLLIEMGYTLEKMKRDNFRVTEFDDLVVKQHYWHWKSKKMKGNTIDFFVFALEKTFAETMRILCPKDGDE